MIPLMEQQVAFLLLYNTKMNMKSISHRIQRCDTGPQIDKSENRNIQNENAQDGRLVDVLNTNPQHQDIPERMTIPKTIQRAASQPQRPSDKQQLDISTS